MAFYGYIGYDVKLSYDEPHAQVCLIISSNNKLQDYICDMSSNNQIFKLCEVHKIKNESPSSHITTLLSCFSSRDAPLTHRPSSLKCPDIAACFVSNNKIHYQSLSDVINLISGTDYDCELNLSGNYDFPDSYDHAMEILAEDLIV